VRFTITIGFNELQEYGSGTFLEYIGRLRGLTDTQFAKELEISVHTWQISEGDPATMIECRNVHMITLADLPTRYVDEEGS
jgi:hypothetical protein